MSSPAQSSTPVPSAVRALADHWGLVLTYGLITLGLGIALLVWPQASLTVFAVLLAIQLIVVGIVRIVRAVSTDQADGAVRALVGLLGGLALIVGLLILRDPLQSVVVLTMILGAFWVIAGVIDILSAFVGSDRPGRGWDVLTGVLSILFGGFLIVDTHISLKVLVVLVGIWLVVVGVVATIAAFRLRNARTEAW
ncbi:HdeD family acid-resistance protein [Nocardioides sp.]|uniref:HdeD family acid-resistance protein n=1 Tax=Nocardioides sp. TaxID=35761 RepID=UPI003783644E